MQRLIVFNSISADGYFKDATNDMSWAHGGTDDPEFNTWTAENAKGGGTLLFGRKTYEMMASFWPTEQAKQQMPEVAEGMNKATKIVFSRTLKSSPWKNTQIVAGDLVSEVRRLKASAATDMVLMGSGTVVAQLTEARLVDEYTFVVVPIVLGKGTTLFEGVTRPLNLKRTSMRGFGNGRVVISYASNAGS